MKCFRVIGRLVVLSLFIFILLGCEVNSNLKGIYDSNDKIAEQGDSYSFSNRVGNANDEVIEVEYNRFSGTETILRIKSEVKGTVRFDFDSELKKGKFKAVVVLPSEEVIPMFEHDAEEEQGAYTLNVEPGVYRVKIVGNNASGEFKLDTELEQNVELLR